MQSLLTLVNYEPRCRNATNRVEGLKPPTLPATMQRAKDNQFLNLNTKTMKLYLLTQKVNNDYDTFDSCIVAAETEQDAKTIYPDGDEMNTPNNWQQELFYSNWVTDVKDIQVKEIGTATADTKRGLILASFNAG